MCKILQHTCCSLLLENFFPFRAQQDSVIAAILTESSSTEQILGLCKIPKNVGQGPREHICKSRKVGGGIMDPLGCKFNSSQGPTPELPLMSSCNGPIEVALWALSIDPANWLGIYILTFDCMELKHGSIIIKSTSIIT
jgi:hypothetical protein